MKATEKKPPFEVVLNKDSVIYQLPVKESTTAAPIKEGSYTVTEISEDGRFGKLSSDMGWVLLTDKEDV